MEMVASCMPIREVISKLKKKILRQPGSLSDYPFDELHAFVDRYPISCYVAAINEKAGGDLTEIEVLRVLLQKLAGTADSLRTSPVVDAFAEYSELALC